MKSTLHQAAPVTLQDHPDAVIEAALLPHCANLSASQRVIMAKVYVRWSDQLMESAMLMEPGLVPEVPEPKTPRGFVLVNYPEKKKAQLRAMARAVGVELRTILGWAVLHAEMHLKERLRLIQMTGISPHKTYKIMDGLPHN